MSDLDPEGAGPQVSTPRNDVYFCASCRHVFSMPFGGRYFLQSGELHRSWTSLINSADSGCLLCIQLKNHLSEYRRAELVGNDSLQIDLSGDGIFEPDDYPGTFRADGEVGGKEFSFQFRTYESSGIRGAFEVPKLVGNYIGDLSEDTGSHQTFLVIKNWLSQCWNQHEGCRIASDASWKPTRLIDVETRQSSNPNKDKIRLINTDEFPPTAGYTTLSHRWGGKVQIRLDISTQTGLQEGFLVKELPKTFADAVNITRRLGFRYLWIDSLCIQQDNTEDWKRESQTMDAVYSHSACNMAANSARDSSVGCFFKRDPKHVQPFEADVLRQGDPPGFVPVTFLRQDVWEEEVEKSVLASRGWVVQERALAPRQVNFTRAGVFWECRCLQAAEFCPEGPFLSKDLIVDWQGTKKLFTELLDGKKQLGGLLERMIVQNQPRTRDDSANVYEGWNGVLEWYSSTNLTYFTDRLVAISGFAKKMEMALGDEYVAGLWRSRLLTELCWNVHVNRPGEPKSCRPRPLLAPTWSWASTVSKISTVKEYFAGAANTMGNQVRDVHLEHRAEDLTGKAICGFLELSVLTGSTSFDLSDDRLRGIHTLGTFRSVPNWGSSVLFDEDVSEQDLRNGCISIALFCNAGQGYVHGLLLRPIGKADNAYERIGYWYDCGNMANYLESLCDEERFGLLRRIVIY